MDLISIFFKTIYTMISLKSILLRTQQPFLPFLLLLWKPATSAFVCNDDFDCAPHGTCGNDLRCVCISPAYTGDQCESTCPIRCQNGAACIMVNTHDLPEENDFRCVCPTGYTGALCHKNVGTNELPTARMSGNNSDHAATIGITIAVTTVVLLVVGSVAAILRRQRTVETVNEPESEIPTEIDATRNYEDVKISTIT